MEIDVHTGNRNTTWACTGDSGANPKKGRHTRDMADYAAMSKTEKRTLFESVMEVADLRACMHIFGHDAIATLGAREMTIAQALAPLRN